MAYLSAHLTQDTIEKERYNKLLTDFTNNVTVINLVEKAHCRHKVRKGGHQGDLL